MRQSYQKNSLKTTRWTVLQKLTLAKSEIYIAISGNMLYSMCFIATEGSLFVQIRAVIGNLALVLICSSHTKILLSILSKRVVQEKKGVLRNKW